MCLRHHDNREITIEITYYAVNSKHIFTLFGYSFMFCEWNLTVYIYGLAYFLNRRIIHKKPQSQTVPFGFHSQRLAC